MNKFIRDTIFLICMLTFSSHWAVSQSSQLWVGTYNSGQATDSGIYAFDFNADRIEAKIISVTQSSNPSFIAISKNGKFLYAVNENGDSASYGSVEAYAFDETTGGLRLLNRQSSQGKHPCHIQI